MDLKGKVAFITGGAEGIGKALAVALLERNCKVFFGDINAATGAVTAEELGKRFGQNNVGFDTMDVADFSRFSEVFSQAVSKFGRVDIMVNNAGIVNESQWTLVVQVNLIGTMNGTKLAMEHMRKDKGGQGGRIINMSSLAGILLHTAIPSYCATKFGVRAYTQSLAANPETTALGIQLAALCPGATDTPQVARMTSDKFPGWTETSRAQETTNLMPPSKVGEALVELLQLGNMNGSVLEVVPAGTTFHTNLNVFYVAPEYLLEFLALHHRLLRRTDVDDDNGKWNKAYYV